MNEDVELRPALGADATAIADLHGRSFLATYADLPRTVAATERGGNERADLWQARLQNPGAGCAVFVANDAGELRGFVFVGPTADTDDNASQVGQVFSIHVDPESWGAGVGSHLLKSAVAFLDASGFTEATLWVVASNSRARAFYEHHGFGLDGALRQENLALAGGDGDLVDVFRYRRRLDEGTEQ